MQVSVLKRNGLKLSQGAAVLFLAGMAAGCSSQVARFGGVDDFMTASTPNQREIIRPSGDTSGAQTYPGDTQPVAAAQTNGAYTGSVSRGALAPVSTAPVEQRSAASRSRPLPPQPCSPLDDTTTGTVKPEPTMAEQGDVKGWSRAGGTRVTVKEGETVYNLSRRFGVPADVIMKSNGLSESDGLKAGSKIVIPTYVYSDKAPVSAPDNNPKTAKAKSSRGEHLPADKEPGAAEPRGAAADAEEQGKVGCDDHGDRRQQQRQARGRRRHLQGAGRRHAVAHRQEYRRRRHRHQGGERPFRRPDPRRPDAEDPGRRRHDQGRCAAPATDAVVTNATKTAGGQREAGAKAEQVAAYTPPKKTDKVIEQAEEDTAAAPDATGIGRMRWPVRGRVISQYGKGSGKSNDGIDISVPEGTPVKAAENGVVIYAGDGLKEFGNTVLVRHEDGLVTVYGHASELKVARGEKVKRGQEIAVSGMSGTTDAPKLHFEVRKNSAPVDPSGYLE